LFRPYFEAVLLSPASQWLLKSMEKIDFTTFNGMVKTATSVVKTDPLVQEYAFEGDVEDMDSCPSTMTYESSGEFLDPIRSNSTNMTQETYSKLWHQFVDTLWNSTDSLWILPCCSEEKPRPLANNVSSSSASATPKSNNDQWLSPSSQEQRQKMVTDVIDQLILNRLDNVSLNENRHNHDHRKVDYDHWLMKSNDHPTSDQQKSTTIDDLNLMEDWLGWKALLEKVRGMGDQCWLYHPPSDSMTKGEQTERTQKIDWITGGDSGQMDF